MAASSVLPCVLLCIDHAKILNVKGAGALEGAFEAS